MSDNDSAVVQDEINHRLTHLQGQLDAQQQELLLLRAQLVQLGRTDRVPLATTTAAPPPPRRLDPTPAATQVVLPPPAPQPQPEAIPLAPFVAAAEIVPSTAPAPFTPTHATAASEKPAPHRSVENRIGAQVFNRVAIVALLIGVALALKFAYDQGWLHVSPVGRIVSGLVLGAGVVLWSERFRRKGYPAFSYSLKAVGTGTLYLTLWASFQIYHLFPAAVALGMMVAVTVWNAAMAWMQDSELLAAYALIGGFASPALLGSGGNHEGFLFSYVLTLDAAVLFLIAKKPWQRLLLGSFSGTVVYFIGWYTKFWSPDQALETACFAMLLAAPFIAVALVGSQRETAGEGVLTPLGAAAFLSLTLYSVLQDSGRHSWLPWGAVLLAAIYLLLMRSRRHGLAEPVHLSLAVVFLVVAVPLKASGRWITIGWLTQGVALLWVATRLLPEDAQARVRGAMRWLGTAALALGVAESLFFWSQQDAQHAFINGRLATELAAVAALALAAWLTRTAKPETDPVALHAPAWSSLSVAASLVLHMLAPLAVCRELTAYWTVGPAIDAGYRTQLSAFSIASVLMVYATCLFAWIAVGRGRNTQPGQRTTLATLAAGYLAMGAFAMAVTPTLADSAPQHAIINARVIFQLCGIAALAISAWFARIALASRTTPESSRLSWPALQLAATLAAHLLAALAGAREIAAWWMNAPAPATASYHELLTVLSVAAWLMIYGAALIVWCASRSARETHSPMDTALRALGCLYLTAGAVPMLAWPVTAVGVPAGAFWNARLATELLGATSLAATTWFAWRARRHDAFWAPVAGTALLVFNLLVLLAGVHEIFTYFGRLSTDASLAEAFSISAWLMLYSGVLLAAGFWKKMAFVRWQGLVLMVCTIVKVFLYDMHSLSSGYRILSFFGLGVVLMVVSFAYQKDWLHLRDAEAPLEATE